MTLGELPQVYAKALEAHLSGSSEDTLETAYELGRQTLELGGGLFDLAAANNQALVARASAGRLTPVQLEAAVAFYSEALSVFEMAARGYRDANRALNERNVELQKAKEAAEAASRELEAFSYSVSHDLRAPLRSIDGFSQALLEDYAGVLDDRGHGYLKRVRGSTQHMARLIDDLLRLARVARVDLEKEIVDLAEVAREILEQLKREAPHRKVETVVPATMVAHGDARLLTVVMENLLFNAWKFSAKQPEARIEVGEHELSGERVFFVKDNGAGFDMKYVDRLFAPFQRLHTADEFEGTGVGLATVQRIIRRHGGRIWAESELSKGSTFSFTLGEAS
jgi:light-regulated signal transduction histidine kinase (bacteriophytochrome)